MFCYITVYIVQESQRARLYKNISFQFIAFFYELKIKDCPKNYFIKEISCWFTAISTNIKMRFRGIDIVLFEVSTTAIIVELDVLHRISE